MRHRLEYAALIDADTGTQLGSAVSGKADEVDIGPLTRRRAPDTRYVCVHTHPANLPFSLEDIAVMLEERYLCMVTAVGRDGSWYIMSVEPGKTPANVATLRDTFREIADATIEKYQVPPFPTERAARRAHMHEIWQRAAPALGLRHDRVEGRPQS
jgi:hypothetical protein